MNLKDGYQIFSDFVKNSSDVVERGRLDFSGSYYDAIEVEPANIIIGAFQQVLECLKKDEKGEIKISLGFADYDDIITPVITAAHEIERLTLLMIDPLQGIRIEEVNPVSIQRNRTKELRVPREYILIADLDRLAV